MLTSIPYNLKLSKRSKRISLKIDHRGLSIISPRQLSQNAIDQLLQKHTAWINQHQEYIQAAGNTQLKLNDGIEITIFGDKEKIKYAHLDSEGQKGKVHDTGEYLVVSAHPGKHNPILVNWLKKTARQGIIARVEELSKQFAFAYESVSVRDQNTRWGSCSSLHNLNFSWRLMLAPMFVLDYVIIHELAHTKEMNHSKRFWTVVADCMPNYKEAKSWLKENGNLLRAY